MNDDQVKRLFKLAERDNAELEIRFGKFIYNKETKRNNFESKVEIPFFYDLKLALEKQNFSKEITKTLDTIYKVENNNIKHTKYIDSDKPDTYIMKNKMTSYRDVYDYDVRFSLASEQPISKPVNLGDVVLVRNKDRVSFSTPVGSIDLTIVNDINYEVEFEIKKFANYDQVMSFMNILLQIRQRNFLTISNYVSRQVKNTYRNMVKVPYFIGAQPETLQKTNISTLYKNKYSVTDKADGDRVFLLIDELGLVYYIDNNIDKVYKTPLKSSTYKNTLIDGELVRIDNKLQFLAFDIIMYNNKDLRGDTQYTLKNRLTRLKDVVDNINRIHIDPRYTISMKKYYYNNVFLASEIILKDIDSKPYNNDGLIFTPMDEPYPTNKKWQTLLKWKPSELNTIDLYAVKTDQTNDWKLYVQHVETKETKETKILTEKNNNSKVLFDTSVLCPEPRTGDFLTSQTTFSDTTIDPTTNEQYKSNTVIEFKWDTDSSKFVPLRTRWDKTANPSKHGNHSSVACSIWDNIHNPITKEVLFKFTTSKNDFFFEKMRNFHNRIKETLYNKYICNSQYLLELCSGKGGDLHKWCNNNVSNVYGYDICEQSITECRRRVTSASATVKNNNYNYNFYNLDLCETNSYKTIMYHSKNIFNNICCQFGVHYFFKSEKSFGSLLDILDNCLNEFGYFIVTFVDNTDLVKLTNNKTCIKEIDNEIVYYIEPNGKENTSIFGNDLRIVLGGNNVLKSGSNEYIINYDYFIKTMQDHGMILVETKRFTELYDDKSMKFSEIEKDISFLNRYCVFQKTSNKTPNIKNYSKVDLNSESKATNKLEVIINKKSLNTIEPVCNEINTPINNCTVINNKALEIDYIKITENFSVHKIQSLYDIIDILNCIQFKYNKYNYDNYIFDSYDSYESISSFFESLTDFVPKFVKDYRDCNLYDNCLNNIYITNYTHIVESKNNTDPVQYMYWYVILYNNKLLFTQHDINNCSIIKKNISKVIEHKKDSIKDKPINEYDNNHNYDKINKISNDKISNKEKIKEILNKNKLTVKLLRECLYKLNLSVSGNKPELISRLDIFLQN